MTKTEFPDMSRRFAKSRRTESVRRLNQEQETKKSVRGGLAFLIGLILLYICIKLFFI